MTINAFSNKLSEQLKNLLTPQEIKNHLAILFEHFLSYSRADLVLNRETEIREDVLVQLDAAAMELLASKPIDYIINESIFFGRPFYVDEAVLVPRSETEELVQWILEEEKSDGKSILDIGTGSGCIPITLALEANFETIHATEVCANAAAVAKKNAKRFGANIQVAVEDILTTVPSCRYDVVVSNPPYVKREEIEGLDKNVKEYEPIIALTPNGDDPLIFYKRLVKVAPEILEKGGVMYWEIHEDLGAECVALMEAENFQKVELREDIYGRDRMVKGVLNA